ncbi:MAG: thioredoxin domain-containing protein [Acidobacteriota bacterium]
MKHNHLLIESYYLGLALLLFGCSGAIAPAFAQRADKVAAVVNGRAISEQELDRTLVSQLFTLQQQIYAIRKTALDNLVIRRLLEDEAKRQGISVEELGMQLTAEKVEVLPAQVDQLYAESVTAFAAMSPDEAKARLRLDLESQARMALYRQAVIRLREKAQVNVLLEEPRLPPFTSENNSSSIGPEGAAITIIEFSDFQCPYCREVQGPLKQVLKVYPSVRLVFKHLPLEIHTGAFSAARAAFCAGQQGSFWGYHDSLFASELLSPEVFNKIAENLGLPREKFQACLSSDAAYQAVLRDKDEAKRFGIDSTPTFIVNGRLVRGTLDFEAFKAVIERELKSLQTTSRTNELGPAKR